MHEWVMLLERNLIVRFQELKRSSGEVSKAPAMLLAKAVAGEGEMPFFSTLDSKFVEMFERARANLTP